MLAAAVVVGVVWRAGRAPCRRGIGAGAQRGAPLPPPPTWKFTARVDGIPVADTAGVPYAQPFLGGFDLPRPQLVDIHGNGKLSLFVQERPDDIMEFEQVDGRWILRAEKYQGLDVGEWFRFVDIDGDGRTDLFAEMPAGYIRMFRNVGTKSDAPKFVAVGDTDSRYRRAADCSLVPAEHPQRRRHRLQRQARSLHRASAGRTVDRFEQDATGPDGTPRFRLIAQNWEGIEILGPEARIGRDTAEEEGPRPREEGPRPGEVGQAAQGPRPN